MKKPCSGCLPFMLTFCLILSSCQPGLTFTSPTPMNTDQPSGLPVPTQPQLVAPTETGDLFDSQRAYADVLTQDSFGPRTPDSSGHAKIMTWIQSELKNAGWDVEVQKSTWKTHTIQNIVASRGPDNGPWIILGAHYDTRMWADQDPSLTKRKDPVPGANDGSSGVAILLELARVLPKDSNKRVWLVFFDLEDQGDIPGWDWILGSTAMAQQVAALPKPPDAVVVIDMVGDANLNIPMERSSDQTLTHEIWSTASRLNYAQYFQPIPGYDMLDDHTPFLQKGIHAVDIIDFDYPYWHTTSDTPDKVSANSLLIVGDTIIHWITGN